jgi:hypothetical protein
MIGTLCLSIDSWPLVQTSLAIGFAKSKDKEKRIMARHVKPTALAASATMPPSADADMRQQDIALSAYYRAEARGLAAGGELGDWLEAEREIAAHDKHE